MKKWQLIEAKKNLEKIIKDVLEGRIQGIMTENGEVVYLVPDEKYPPIKDGSDLSRYQEKVGAISSEPQ